MLRSTYEKRLRELEKTGRYDQVTNFKLQAQREGIVDIEDMKAQRSALDEQIKQAEADEAK